MTGSDLIVVAPWIIFGVCLAVLCVRLLRARRSAHAAAVRAAQARRLTLSTGSGMRREEHVADGPRWRAILEARWRDRLQEVTELSLAYHVAVGGRAGRQRGQAGSPAAPPRRRRAAAAGRHRGRAEPAGGRELRCGASSAAHRSRCRCSSPPRSPGTARAAPGPALQPPAGMPVSVFASLQVDSVALLPGRAPPPGSRRDLPRRCRARRRSSPSASRPRAAPIRGSRCSLPARPRARSSATTSATCSAAASGPPCSAGSSATPKGMRAPRVGGAVARPVRHAAHHRLPVHPRRPHRGDPHLRPHRLPAPAVRPRDRGGRRHLGALRVLDRPSRRPGLRGQPLDGLVIAFGATIVDQRRDRGHPPAA